MASPLGAEVGSALAAVVGQGLGGGCRLWEWISLVFGAAAARSPALSWLGRGTGGCSAVLLLGESLVLGQGTSQSCLGLGLVPGQVCYRCCVSYLLLAKWEHLCLLPAMALFTNAHHIPSSVILMRLKMPRQVQTHMLHWPIHKQYMVTESLAWARKPAARNLSQGERLLPKGKLAEASYNHKAVPKGSWPILGLCSAQISHDFTSISVIKSVWYITWLYRAITPGISVLPHWQYCRALGYAVCLLWLC